ncbi:hypothetical protein QTO34_016717 [Cnephaeus nilssonii]|uniref:Uncharacterized protein n=1 Tax=Cnephaeus nilssonii TaxID=3371016 RepID=A0AA40I2U5_CNENI|nr:hypothetical protein QTO34_016717 [Eptesicus nilssonii]
MVRLPQFGEATVQDVAACPAVITALPHLAPDFTQIAPSHKDHSATNGEKGLWNEKQETPHILRDKTFYSQHPVRSHALVSRSSKCFILGMRPPQRPRVIRNGYALHFRWQHPQPQDGGAQCPQPRWAAGMRHGRARPQGAPRVPERPQGRRQQLLGKQWAPWPRRRSQEKQKVNCKPKNQDEQEIPFHLRETEEPPGSENPSKGVGGGRGVDPDNADSQFKQKWESDRAYIQRTEQEAQHVLFLSKNQADRQPEAQVARKKESEGKKAFQSGGAIKCGRKEEKAAERLEQELLGDTVKFGEVACSPPS